ncbi:hypothetical protein J5N97_009081 [Dioscorea zingiberensis]|uniref:Saposin B-type domain-containing protein n=1 Tax=Dioscorea zingiberensis TaxID=325984 RepID=A0A9D5CW74_9LILI|nr:hypothetical protein J5N97_009081 [Dioscorea zingiberensis]
MSTGFQCGSCLEASRSAEKTLNNLKMFEEVSMLSKKVCQALPVDLEIKCLKKSEDYIQYTQSMFQELFHEESLCNSTRLCSNENRVPSNGFLTDKESGGGSCSKCSKTVGKLISDLKDPRMKTKVTNAMLNFCEEKDENHQKCDETVYQYGAVVLDKLEHAKSKDLCKALSICGGGDDEDDD